MSTPIWQYKEPNEQSLEYGLTEAISNLEKQNPNIFPNLRESKEILIASDYGGDAKFSRYFVYSYLIMDRQKSSNWEHKIATLRGTTDLANHKMEYKGLGSGERARALKPFLEIIDEIFGVTITFAIDKRFKSLVVPKPSDFFHADFSSTHHIKHIVVEKFIQIASYLSLICSGLLNESQRVKWVTDDDNFMTDVEENGNTARTIEPNLQEYGQNIMSQYPLQVELEFATDQIPYSQEIEDKRILMVSDFTATPDLIVGAVSATMIRQDGTPPKDPPPEKALKILEVLKQHKHIKHIFIFLDFDPDNSDSSLIGGKALNN